MKSVFILGTRGIPAQHGGFETFAEHLALYLLGHGWRATVYCQEDGDGAVHEDEWQRVRRIHIPVSHAGAIGTMQFDWASVTHLLREPEPGLALTLGYNTALFCARLRVRGIPNLINMDGLEWKRDKWSFPARAWLWLNERAGCLLGNHLIADHPEIENHLATRVRREKITMIPYGADSVTEADAGLLQRYGLEPDRFAVVIARPEPENSILEIVRAFSARRRGMTLAVLGRYSEQVPFQAEVMRSASAEVKFLGAIYEQDAVAALRYYSRAYVHGHRVGGTNPSLVEALGAGCPVLAHDNPFNRWVAGADAWYFNDESACAGMFDRIAEASPDKLNSMRESSRRRHREVFTWESVLAQYESVLAQWVK
jgi:glycosyltransferase involved in cell wall biosynthesis